MNENSFPATIPELFAWRARASAAVDAPWLVTTDESLSMADVSRAVDRVAVGLAERGVARGDRVAMLLGNTPETLFAWLATNQLGAIAAPLNPALKPPEVAGLLTLIEPRVLVMSPDHRSLVEAALAMLDEARRPTVVAPAELASAGAGAPRVPVDPDDVAVLLGTSGTTGAPKAVMQTHRTYTLTAEAFASWVRIGPEDRVLVALPLFHVNAQAYGVMGALGAGASLALAPKFSASRFWDDARRLGGTQVNAVGAMLHILLRTAASPADRAHALRVVYSALAMPAEQHEAFEARFGVELTVGYGLSESTFGTVWPRALRGSARPFTTMGRLRQHPRLGEINRARVVRDDGTDAEVGEVGEMWLSNPATMKGYFRDPAQTEAVLPGDGWLRTGDLVRRDRYGFFTFVARKKDVIRRRGENIAAAEIENVLAAHPTVREAAAVGAPSDLGEEEVVAYVVPRPGAEIDVPALLAWARERLADHKVPSRVHVRDELPRTATERVAKHLLR